MFSVLSGVLRKATKHLIEAEEETEAIWKDKVILSLTLDRVYAALVASPSPETIVLSPGNILFLKAVANVKRSHRMKLPLRSSSVPILSWKLEEGKALELLQQSSDSEIILQRLYPFLNQGLPLKWLAAAAEVSKEIAEKSVRNLAYYGLVDFVEIFSFSNRYRATPRLPLLLTDKALADRCWDYCTKSKTRFYERNHSPQLMLTPLFHNEKELKLFAVYSSLCNAKSLGDFCSTYELGSLNERRVVNFGIVEGLLLQVNEHLLVERKAVSSKKLLSSLKAPELFDNLHSLHDVCV